MLQQEWEEEQEQEASPVIARFAKEVKLDSTEEQILVVGVVTLPFSFEGRKRKTQAQEGIKRLKEEVDAVITINTDKLREYGNFTMTKAFSMADDILLTAAKGISEMMTGIGRVHVDFRDVQSVMQNSGVALMGTGIAEGENRALEAIQAATTSKLLNDNDISATKQILLYFVSSEENEVRMEEIDTITSYLEEVTNNEVDYIWGTGIDDTLDDKLSITLVATGFESKEIYTPTQRTTTISITPPKSTQQPTEIPVAQVAPQEPYIKSTETETSIEDTKKDTTQIVDEGKEEKIVISVNEFGQPIKKNPSTTSVETETKFTGIIQEPQIAVITKQEDTTKNETPVVTPPPTTNMNDLWGVNTMQNVTAEERMIRIQKIKKMMETEEGINQLASFSPIQLMNSNQEYSQTNNTSNYSINKEGQLVLMKNPALNAQVD